MSPWIFVGLGSVALWFVSAKPSRALVGGKSYEATFQFPPGFDTKLLPKAFPAGAGFEVDDTTNTFAVNFVAPVNGTIGDVPTPLGTLKFVNLRELG